MRSLFGVIFCLALAAAVGAIAATSLTCGVGLARGTDTWCGLGSIWIAAIPLAVVCAVAAGTPMFFMFRWLRLEAWWQYTLAGAAAAVPGWFLLARPFTSARWEQSGLYDSLNYLGTGALAALAFHVLLKHVFDLDNAA